MTLKKEISSKFILEKITDIYIALIIILFPLIVDSTGFFKILECKYESFLLISGSYLITNFLVLMYYWLVKRENVFKEIKITKVQIAALVFWGINILSYIFSPYIKEANLLIGVGRGEGLINMSLYVLTFLCVTLFGKFKKRHIVYFSISSILVNFIAILQYIGFNPFNMYQEGIGTHNVSFMGTIGNVDFISALFCILLPISCFAYINLEDTKLNKTLHLLSILMGSFIFNIIDVNSGKVGLFGILVIAFPFIVTSSKRLAKLVTCINMVLIANCINYFMNTEYHYDIGKIVFNFKFNYIVILFLVMIAVLFVLAKMLKKIQYDYSENKKVILTFFGVYVLVGVIAVTALYLYDFGFGMLTEIHEILHGNLKDEYGTFRVFLWKRTLSIIPEYPILGSGPDSFAIRFMSKFSQDVASIGELSINDTAANVYLTMAVNIGIVGLVSYLVFLYTQIKRGIKYKNKESVVLLLTIICYLIQDVFNLWVVIITPIFWLLMAIHFISLKREESVNV